MSRAKCLPGHVAYGVGVVDEETVDLLCYEVKRVEDVYRLDAREHSVEQQVGRTPYSPAILDGVYQRMTLRNWTHGRPDLMVLIHMLNLDLYQHPSLQKLFLGSLLRGVV